MKKKILKRYNPSIVLAYLTLTLGTATAQNSSYNANNIPILGTNSTAFGEHALFTNFATGSHNTASGYYSLNLNSSGSRNSGYGAQTLASNNTGAENTAVGYQSLFANSNGNNNTSVGLGAMIANIGGGFNSAHGSNALERNTTGSVNVAVGYKALVLNTTGSNNTAIGGSATVSTTNLNNATAIGYAATVNASNKIRLGNSSVTVVEGPVAYTVSDGRFKNNISESDVKGLDFIKRLRPVVYNFDTKKLNDFLTKNVPADALGRISDNEFAASTAIRQSGFIAQEVEKAAQDAGYNFNGIHKPDSEDDNYSLAYGQFVVPLVKGMQEQQAMIEKQQVLIEKQQKQIDELKKLIVTTQVDKESAMSTDVQIYPNPSNGMFSIHAKGIETGAIEVINLEGKSIYKTGITGNTTDYKIDLSGYAHGTYLVTISSAGAELVSKKIIVE